MKLILKLLTIIFLLALMFFSISVVKGATSVTIEGTGTATAKSDGNGNFKWECIPPSPNPCKITVVFNE